jgi:DNA-binding response OmpR family regulator
VTPKTVLLVDDEQSFLEALADALAFEGYRVLKARDVSTALAILQREQVDLVTVDIMLSPGASLDGKVDPQRAGVYLCEKLFQAYPQVPAFCLSVVNNTETICRIQDMGIRFLRKGETPLRTVLGMIKSQLTGIAYKS